MTQNLTKTLVSGAFGNSLEDKSVGDLFIFCPQTARVSRRIFFFVQRLKKTCSLIKFDGSVGKPETRLIYALFLPKFSPIFVCKTCRKKLENQWTNKFYVKP